MVSDNRVLDLDKDIDVIDVLESIANIFFDQGFIVTEIRYTDRQDKEVEGDIKLIKT